MWILFFCFQGILSHVRELPCWRARTSTWRAVLVCMPNATQSRNTASLLLLHQWGLSCTHPHAWVRTHWNREGVLLCEACMWDRNREWDAELYGVSLISASMHRHVRCSHGLLVISHKYAALILRVLESCMCETSPHRDQAWTGFTPIQIYSHIYIYRGRKTTKWSDRL